jgi:hypothetical protein
LPLDRVGVAAEPRTEIAIERRAFGAPPMRDDEVTPYGVDDAAIVSPWEARLELLAQ